MLDTVTVVFKDELPALRCQAESFKWYAADLPIETIWVIVNDTLDVVDLIDPQWWGSRAHRVRIIHRSVYGDYWSDNGWVSQQVLKLQAAAYASRPWSIVFDAKTILIKPLKVTDIFDNKRVRMNWMPIYSVFEPSRQITNQLLGIDLKEQLGPGGVPFFFHTETAYNLVNYVKDFNRWFQDAGMLTEFLLYSGFVKAKNPDIYTDANWLTVCNICHSEVGIFNEKMKQAENSYTISIHRNAWNKLTAEQQDQYKTFLRKRGISSAVNL